MKNLYNKWRPKKFSEVISNNNIIKYIKKILFLNEINHSYLFVGPRGVGKTTIARLMAKSINCLNINKFINNNNNNFPCLKCRICEDIDNNNMIDFIEIDSSLNSGIEYIKEILNSLQYLPIYSKYKIYLIDEIHILTKQSFSALLKSLEEPPKYIIFILITTEINKIPDTIISRCIILNFNYISVKNIIKKLIFILNKENIIYDINALYLISESSNGSMRDSINIIEQLILIDNSIKYNSTLNILGILNLKILINILKSIIYKKINILIYILNKIKDFNINYNDTIKKMLLLVHNIFMLSINKNYIINNQFLKFKKDILKLILINNEKYYINIYNVFMNKNIIFNNNNNDYVFFEIILINIYFKINNIARVA